MNVTALSMTPVKGLRLQRVEQIDLRRSGALGDRRFFVIDGRDRLVNGKVIGELQSVSAEERDGDLALEFPDGRVVRAPLSLGDAVQARFFSLEVEARLLDGPWADALSEHVGREVRLVEAPGSVDRGSLGAASLISRASLERLAAQASAPAIDARRFRMLIEIDGVDAHEEDAWVDRVARIGQAEICWGGHVGRCLTTSRDPETGVTDLPTLDLLGQYRRDVQSTEPLPFGIYGQVVQEGVVRVGDAVRLL